MSDPHNREELGERVLMLAPTFRDAAMAHDVLAEAGFTPHVIRVFDDFASELAAGAGVIILMEEFFATKEAERLLGALERQPAWSSLPLIVLSSGKGHLSGAEAALKMFANVVLLERPARIVTLVSAIRAALGARRRQYELRDSIEAMRQTAEERDRLYREAEAARLEAEAADHRKNEFLAMLAHELRNPLSAIGNALSLSTRSELHEHIEWSLEVIGRQMKHLTRLIDDLMDVSRINRGKIELRREVLELTAIIDSALVTVNPLVEERKHTLVVDADRGRLWARVDPTRLEQVIVNLLNNAAKYSDNGGHIRLSAKTDGKELEIAVADQGIGIPPEKLPLMFELFAQGDRSLARSEGGLGIGLTVAKRLMEMHGGTIDARSEGPGKGSIFTIRLPAAPRPAAARPKTHEPLEKASKASRILVVDDNVDTARGVAKLLQLLGHQVAVAHSGLDALEVAKRHEPEFVLLDIGLPGMDGYQVASRLRSEDCCKDSIIVAVSGYGQEEDRRRSKAAGFDFHLVKPLDPDTLFSLLSAGSNIHP